MHLKIDGSSCLQGRIRASGAKNAVTKLLVASLLSDKKVHLSNVPNIGDVAITVELCQELGSQVVWDQEAKTIEIITKELNTSYIPQKYCGANRIPILLIGALLGRTYDDIIIPTVGGDAIGKRSVDFHIAALEKLGAKVEYREMKKEGAYLASAHHGLQGNEIILPYPSVGATENSILASVRAKGTTLIKNAALEPEILDLILFLQKLGALITVENHRMIRIEGTQQFQEVWHKVIPDRTEVASFAMAAIATQGRIFIEDAQHIHMIPLLYQLKKLGAGYECHVEGIEFYYNGPLKGGIHVETDVYPGFLTDWQQPFTLLLTQAQGISIIHETVHENRFEYVHTLNEMGAHIHVVKGCLGHTACRYAHGAHNHSAVIYGKTDLQGHVIHIPDLRAGFAYVMAALIASSQSVISGIPFLERGYDDLVGKLQRLGGKVELVPSLDLSTVH